MEDVFRNGYFTLRNAYIVNCIHMFVILTCRKLVLIKPIIQGSNLK